jgi:hypothetical protein
MIGGLVLKVAFDLLFCLPFVALTAAAAPIASSRGRLVGAGVLCGAVLGR